jgi:hypothetical protein
MQQSMIAAAALLADAEVGAQGVSPQAFVESFMMGAIAMACFVAGLFFLRFWRDTHDRLFVIFAMAFWLLGLTRLLLAWASNQSETQNHYLYWLRFAAFALILFAIVDKNRPRAKAEA